MAVSSDKSRRGGPDMFYGVLVFFKVVSWISLFAALVVLGLAKPLTRSIYDDMYNAYVRTTWKIELLEYIQYFLIISICTSIAGCLLSVIRARRENERYPISLILAVVISINAMLLFFYYF
jgi:hypothetical protein